MNWYDIIVILFGAVGGTTGLISLYHAKSKKDTIDISNFHSLLEEERTERKNLSQEYHEYKGIVERKVENVKKEFDELRHENPPFGVDFLYFQTPRLVFHAFP